MFGTMGNTLEKGTKIVGEDQRVDFPLTFNCQRGCVNQIKRERERALTSNFENQ